MASSFNTGGKRGPDALCCISGHDCRPPQPMPHLVQELHGSPQDLPPLVHLATLWNCFAGPGISAHPWLSGGTYCGEDRAPSGVLASPTPASSSQPPGATHYPLARARLCQDSKR